MVAGGCGWQETRKVMIITDQKMLRMLGIVIDLGMLFNALVIA